MRERRGTDSTIAPLWTDAKLGDLRLACGAVNRLAMEPPLTKLSANECLVSG